MAVHDPDLAAWHSRIDYLVFVPAVVWALARSGSVLLWALPSDRCYFDAG